MYKCLPGLRFGKHGKKLFGIERKPPSFIAFRNGP